MSGRVLKTFDEFINRPLPQKDELLAVFNTSAPLVIFDIGCCEGEDSIRYLKLFPDSHVHAFEALPGNFKIATKNFKKYGVQNSISLNNVALSDVKGKANFYVSTGEPEEAKDQPNWDFGNKSSSLLKPNKTLEVTPWLKFKDKIKVHTNTLDNYCSDHKIFRIDLIHLDVQGAELMVLRGGETILQKTKAIWLEVEAMELYKDQPLKNDVEDFMFRRGFEKKIDTVDSIAGDQLYINKVL